MSGRPLSVEIFRDTLTPDAPIEEVMVGVQNVAAYATDLQIVRTDRKIRLGGSNPGFLDMNIERWPRFQADINLVATSRTIDDTAAPDSFDIEALEAKHPAGFSVVRGSEWKSLMRAAVIDTSLASRTPVVAAHEVAHLFEVEPAKNPRPHDPRHCAEPECILYFRAQGEIDVVKVTQRGLRAFIKNRVRGQQQYEVTESFVAKDFCGSCASQVGMKAFYLAKAKRGETIPESLYRPSSLKTGPIIQ